MTVRLDPKPPKNLPVVGDRCRLRGRDARGELRKVNDLNKWAEVDWDADARGPTIVHHWELEKTAAQVEADLRERGMGMFWKY